LQTLISAAGEIYFFAFLFVSPTFELVIIYTRHY